MSNCDHPCPTCGEPMWGLAENVHWCGACGTATVRKRLTPPPIGITTLESWSVARYVPETAKETFGGFTTR